MQRIKELFHKRNIRWFALALLATIVLIFLVFTRKVDEYKETEHDMYQYLMGIKLEYTGVIKINKDNNSITRLSFKGQSVELDSTPIYYKDSKKVIFPKNMAVEKPVFGMQYKVNYYSTIYNDDDFIYVKDGNMTKHMENMVVYDGNDLYFFVEKTKVNFGKEEFVLGSLSYVVVDTLNDMVMVYDYDKDSFQVFKDVLDEVIISTDNYKINATLDLMYYNDKSRLLIKDIDKLRHFSEE